ncbi:unnamed protein product [Fraxinus pennsylvanica]|uniref:Uncharacterized protein n=1 Tax=Fraxinus pennsylvanica TaxID=56036 RepID=A0AAD1ZKR3_9LAMI|nr:unnamed protein product [Fraxinus pennsylvanica]
MTQAADGAIMSISGRQEPIFAVKLLLKRSSNHAAFLTSTLKRRRRSPFHLRSAPFIEIGLESLFHGIGKNQEGCRREKGRRPKEEAGDPVSQSRFSILGWKNWTVLEEGSVCSTGRYRSFGLHGCRP